MHQDHRSRAARWSDLVASIELLVLVVLSVGGALTSFAAIVLTAFWTRWWIVDALLLAYLVVSLPINLAQAGMLFDCLLKFIGDRPIVLPVLSSLVDRADADPVTRLLAGILTTISPLSGPSMVAFDIISPPQRPIDLARAKYRTEAALMIFVLSRLPAFK